LSTVKVLVAEDSAVLRDALAELIRDDPRLDLVGMAADAGEAIAMAGAHHPQVAVLDVKMPGGGGRHAAAEISQVSPGTRVLAFSAYDDKQSIEEMLDAGAFGYVVKGARMDEVIREILRAAGASDRDT
jgi:DNA-binding NarL/FixJ family response regulator